MIGGWTASGPPQQTLGISAQWDPEKDKRRELWEPASTENEEWGFLRTLDSGETGPDQGGRSQTATAVSWGDESTFRSKAAASVTFLGKRIWEFLSCCVHMLRCHQRTDGVLRKAVETLVVSLWIRSTFEHLWAVFVQYSGGLGLNSWVQACARLRSEILSGKTKQMKIKMKNNKTIDMCHLLPRSQFPEWCASDIPWELMLFFTQGLFLRQPIDSEFIYVEPPGRFWKDKKNLNYLSSKCGWNFWHFSHFDNWNSPT